MGKKITLDDVEKWKEMRNKGYPLREIAKQFCTSPKTIGKYLKEEGSITSQDVSNCPSNSAGCNSDAHSISDIEKDPDILKMKKQLEIAKLKRQIREAEAPLELENRVEELERQISLHKAAFQELIKWKKEIDGWANRINNTPAISLEIYKCDECGAEGKTALYIQCTECEDKTWWGHFDRE